MLIHLPWASIHAARADHPEKKGNFLLSSSQQIGPLFGFGQNIVDKHDTQVFANLQQFGGIQKNHTSVLPSILYGIRNNLSIFITFPNVPPINDGFQLQRNLNSIVPQLEYAFINKETKTSTTQMTGVFNVSIPTGSSKKRIINRSGSTSICLGSTLSYMTQWWSGWVQAGAVLTASGNHNTKLGNRFLYQAGLEKYFATRDGWIFAGIIELFGIHEQINNQDALISGKNTFFIGPSLWASSHKIIMQLGLATPIKKHTLKKQFKRPHFLSVNLAYKF
ncbi:MAG: hypothetical protein ABUT20_47170 [Bacteroidota bacterium]